MVLLIILAIVFGISIASLIGGILLLYKASWAKFLSKYLISFAIGALFGAVFLDILPEAIDEIGTQTALVYSLFGVFMFYLLEKTLIWYHHHSYEFIHHTKHPPEEKVHPVGYLITFGDAIHNFLDGVIIAASFLISFKLGITTSLAVLFHELPQEIGDFSVMLHAKFSRLKTFSYNLLAQLTAVLGAVLGFFYLPLFDNLQAILLSLAAGGFIYIASTDLLPETHREKDFGKSLLQIILLVLGVFVIWYTGRIFPE